MPGKVIAQPMAHAKVDTTLNVYTQVVDGSLRTSADTVGSELFTNRKEPTRQVVEKMARQARLRPRSGHFRAT